MPGLIRILSKLRGRSGAELKMRAGQVIAAAAERHGISPDLRSFDDAEWIQKMLVHESHPDGGDAAMLLERFRSRATPSFFASFHDPDTTLAELRARWPKAEERILEQAGRIRAGRFDFLGCGDISFGDPIDWHLDPALDRRAPLAHWSRIPFLDASVVGDHKRIWELNRHQYLLVLGRAYWYTGDESYADTFVQHLSAWMDSNPPKRGINWASSLELAFRAIAWIWALHFFRHSPRLTPEFFLRVCRFLYLHGKHVETYLSTYFSPNTHLTGEALGLVYLGTCFPEFRLARRWRERGVRILKEQLDVQVHGDGVYFEQATYYHRYTADFFLHLLILARANGYGMESHVEQKLQALLDHLMYLTEPNGSIPLFGDDDGGRLLPIGERRINDFRDTLATGAVLLNRSDYRFVAGDPAEETLWLLGPEGLRSWDAITPESPRSTSVAFPEGGYFVMRDGWSSDANYLAVDCGPHGAMNCGHAHADALAFELAARGMRMLIDPGTYTYTGAPALRDRLRSSRAHNTLSIDGESSSTPAGPFQWGGIAECSLRRWTTAERFDFFEGSQSGYTRLPDPALHTRAIFFLKGDYWIIRDQVAADGEHELELRFQFAPEVRVTNEVEMVSGQIETPNGRPTLLRIQVFGADELHCESAPVSRSYGELTEAPACTFTGRGTGVRDWISVLVPAREGEAVPAVERQEAAGGHCFLLRCGLHEDQLALSASDDEAAGPGLRSDFGWSWLRRVSGDASLQEFVLLDGHRLEVGGKEMVQSDQLIGFLAARIEGPELQVQTDATRPFRLHACGALGVRVNGVLYEVGRSGHCTVDPARNSDPQAARNATFVGTD